MDIQDRRKDKRVRQLPLPRELQLEVRDNLPTLRIDPPNLQVFDRYRYVEREYARNSDAEERDLVRQRAVARYSPFRGQSVFTFDAAANPPRYEPWPEDEIVANDLPLDRNQTSLPQRSVYQKFAQMFPR